MIHEAGGCPRTHPELQSLVGGCFAQQEMHTKTSKICFISPFIIKKKKKSALSRGRIQEQTNETKLLKYTTSENLQKSK